MTPRIGPGRALLAAAAIMGPEAEYIDEDLASSAKSKKPPEAPPNDLVAVLSQRSLGSRPP